MKKPIPREMKPIMVYNEMIDFIENQYNINTRDYKGTINHIENEKGNEVPEYLDYWLWLNTYEFQDTEIGKKSYWDVKGIMQDDSTPEWVSEITQLIHKEFKSRLDSEGGLFVLIEK